MAKFVAGQTPEKYSFACHPGLDPGSFVEIITQHVDEKRSWVKPKMTGRGYARVYGGVIFHAFALKFVVLNLLTTLY